LLRSALLAFGVRIARRPLIGSASPFLMFTPALAIASLYGGGFSGALATAASAILGSHFFLRALGDHPARGSGSARDHSG
jgi:hypothetical protein